MIYVIFKTDANLFFFTVFFIQFCLHIRSVFHALSNWYSHNKSLIKKNNDILRNQVKEALNWVPLLHTAELDVHVNEGAVDLQGT